MGKVNGYEKKYGEIRTQERETEEIMKGQKMHISGFQNLLPFQEKKY